MAPELQEIAYALLRLSLDAEPLAAVTQRLAERPLTPGDWKTVYDFCKKQTIIGVVLLAVNKLPEALRPPKDIWDHWILQGFYIQRDNMRLNQMCAKITQMFTQRGLHPVILKGQANAHLYPNPYCRQCGDIDVFVEGGRRGVTRHLSQMGLMKGADTSLHHVHLDSKPFDGISVEVHFKPVTCMPLGKGRHLQKFLVSEALEHRRLYESAGFYEPTHAFALMMQLSHIRRHFISEGIGLRQLVDYYLLLKTATPQELEESRKNLKKCGLVPMGRALMYVLKTLLKLDDSLALCEPDEKWGQKLLDQVREGGNFGRDIDRSGESLAKYWLKNRENSLKFAHFDFAEAIWVEFSYWFTFIRYIPRRVKQRKLSLRR